MFSRVVRLAIVSILFVSNIFSQGKANDWENPQLLDVNKEVPHTGFMLFESQQDVITDDYSKSPFFQSLNGTWKFDYTAKHADRIKDFYRTDLNSSSLERYCSSIQLGVTGFRCSYLHQYSLPSSKKSSLYRRE